MASSICRLETNPPTSELLKIAEKEVGETTTVVQEALVKMRLLLEGSSAMPKPRALLHCCRTKPTRNSEREHPLLNFGLDDGILTIFLRRCKFYSEDALKLMKRVAAFKEENDIIANLDIEDVENIMLNHNVVNIMANRDQNGRRIIILNLGGAWNTIEVNGDQIFMLLYLAHIGIMLEPETQIRGVVVLFDFENFGESQKTKLTESFAKRIMKFIQNSMPLRLKGVHVVKYAFNIRDIWKPFERHIEEKLEERLFFHGNVMESLHKHIDPSYLPENYGGTLPRMSYTSADWLPVMKEIQSKVVAWNSFGYKKKNSE
ncbi:clavesin-1 [Halyomorpha halys]|uniref:clavesin-1 n=1 Tax=Halyomorpha halys TaxID=286706 RepID=UPI0006D515B7|nr:clavesin-1 [Halyomorpha halys]